MTAGLWIALGAAAQDLHGKLHFDCREDQDFAFILISVDVLTMDTGERT